MRTHVAPMALGGGVRTQRNGLGTLDVPANTYWGIPATRAPENFLISGRSISEHQALIVGIACVEQAAALANAKVGELACDTADPINTACGKIKRGKLLIPEAISTWPASLDAAGLDGVRFRGPCSRGRPPRLATPGGIAPCRAGARRRCTPSNARDGSASHGGTHSRRHARDRGEVRGPGGASSSP